MPPAKKQSASNGHAVVKLRRNNKKRKNGERKSPVFVQVEKSSQSAKEDRLTNKPINKPIKNIHLVEGDPIDTEGISRKREMRCFPNEDCLSAKIQIANGTDYSNHFIEQHFNRRSLTSIRKTKKNSKNFGVVELLKKRKIFLDDLGLDFENKTKSPLPIANDCAQNVVAVFSDSSEEEVKTIEHKNIGNDSTGVKCNRKENKMKVLPKLVPYSSSENESDDDDDKSNFSSLGKSAADENISMVK